MGLLVSYYFLARMFKTLQSVGGHDFFARQDLFKTLLFVLGCNLGLCADNHYH